VDGRVKPGHDKRVKLRCSCCRGQLNLSLT
jgi:hypothetical protein